MKVGGVRFLLTSVLGKVFEVVRGWILMVPCSSSTLTMFGRDKALLRGILVGGVWNGFLLEKVKGQRVPCRFCGGTDSDRHLFGECPFLRAEIREHPEFHDLMEMDKSSWPRCLLWHGWLPKLSGVNGGSPWAGSLWEGAANLLECALGRYSSDALTEWQLPVGFDAVASARRVAAEPDVWTDGSLVDDKVSGPLLLERVVLPTVVVVFGRIGGGAIWMKMLGRMQWLVPVVVFVLCLVQAHDGVHLWVDNLGVVRHVGRLLDGKTASRPAELVKDGDLVLFIERMLRLRELDTVRISKVQGHADEALVRAGGLVILIGWVIMERMRLLTLVVRGCLGG